MQPQTINLNSVAWDSRYRYERIAVKSHASFSSGSPVSLTASHNLGYVPYFRSYAQFSGDSRYYYIPSGNPSAYYGTFATYGVQVVNYYADTSNLYITFDGYSGTLAGTWYYRIYAEPQSS